VASVRTTAQHDFRLLTPVPCLIYYGALVIAVLRKTTVARPEPLLEYLLAALGMKRTAVKNLLKFGAVAVNGEVVRQFDHALVVGDDVVVSDLRTASAVERLASAKIQIVYEDDALIAVDKPSGLLTVATENDKRDTLFFRLKEFLAKRDVKRSVRPLVVHRLDQGTSGLVLFAKNQAVKQTLQDDWPAVSKRYLAVVEGRPSPSEGTISSFITESTALKSYGSHEPADETSRQATTHYRVLQTKDEWSLVEARLETGRKHQIRVHFSGIGCPIAGDELYEAETDPCGRLGLHAFELSFSHPTTGETINLKSPLPKPLGKLFPDERFVEQTAATSKRDKKN
jgi:23S rRNA pseudouridine1911/1915/1917 synthase